MELLRESNRSRYANPLDQDNDKLTINSVFNPLTTNFCEAMQLTTSYKKRERDNSIIKGKFLWNNVSLTLNDCATIVTLGCIATYFGFFQPAVLLVACIFSLFAVCFNLIQRGMMLAGVYIPVKTWHLAAVVLASTAVFGHFEAPAFAQFFNNLEEGITEVIADANTGIDEAVIETIFVFFRIIIVLAFLIGVVVVFTQATRGNDWQPIANLLAIGLAFVIGVEVITTLILGETAAG